MERCYPVCGEEGEERRPYLAEGEERRPYLAEGEERRPYLAEGEERRAFLQEERDWAGEMPPSEFLQHPLEEHTPPPPGNRSIQFEFN